MTDCDKTCGTCRHWVKQPSIALDVSEGDCYGAPPTPIPAQNPMGRQVWLSVYPRLGAKQRACAVHEPRMEIALES
jgi:hypothetical protein